MYEHLQLFLGSATLGQFSERLRMVRALRAQLAAERVVRERSPLGEAGLGHGAAQRTYRQALEDLLWNVWSYFHQYETTVQSRITAVGVRPPHPGEGGRGMPSRPPLILVSALNVARVCSYVVPWRRSSRISKSSTRGRIPTFTPSRWPAKRRTASCTR